MSGGVGEGPESFVNTLTTYEVTNGRGTEPD